MIGCFCLSKMLGHRIGTASLNVKMSRLFWKTGICQTPCSPTETSPYKSTRHVLGEASLFTAGHHIHGSLTRLPDNLIPSLLIQ